jgi:hypothetical protein
MRSVRSHLIVSPVAHDLLRIDLPELPSDRRDEVVAFTCRRIDHMPTPTKAGVLAVALVLRCVIVVPGGRRLLSMLATRPLPLLGEYLRLLRSLAAAYVWEHWPATTPDGAPT